MSIFLARPAMVVAARSESFDPSVATSILVEGTDSELHVVNVGVLAPAFLAPLDV